ncbi:MAG: ATP-binding protein [Nonlabens sp.]
MYNQPKKITRVVLIGGPASGKTSLINALIDQGFTIHEEISRTVTARAQEQGIQQLFLEDPFAFSNELLSGRVRQYHGARSGINIYDRGIPDVPAYHIYSGDPIPGNYRQQAVELRYDIVLYLPPWEEIYIQDSERYESWEQAQELGKVLYDYYQELDYRIIQVPTGTVEERLSFVLKTIEALD